MLINSGIIIYCLTECLLWVPGSREKQRKSNTSAILMVFRNVKTLRSEMQISLSHHHWHCWRYW